MAPQTRSQADSAPDATIRNVLPRTRGPEEAGSGPNLTPRSNDAHSTRSRRRHRRNDPDEPPRFRIDLSLPPEQRYLDVCTALKSEMLGLTSLFDEVVGEMIPFISVRWLHLLCRIFLRGVYSKEENAELKGISKATGVDMYLLVCFNVLLDLFMGCSSGGAVVRSGREIGHESKMVHFRTLDWNMDSLRRVVVQLDYVLEKDGPVVATSVTYAGFVGVLTGVRKGLSMSLNFRHNRIGKGKFWSDVKYCWHLLMVLLGWRPSISSTLRRFLLPERADGQRLRGQELENDRELVSPGYRDVVISLTGSESNITPITTTACYLCFSDGHETTVLEKDRIAAKTRSSADFIVVTNGDAEPNANDEKKDGWFIDGPMLEIFAESEDRQQCARENWTSMRAAKFKRLPLDAQSGKWDGRSLMEVVDVIRMVQKYTITNECTHFAAVMDPSEGDVKWCRRWMEPVDDEWIRRHMSKTV